MTRCNSKPLINVKSVIKCLTGLDKFSRLATWKSTVQRQTIVEANISTNYEYFHINSMFHCLILIGTEIYTLCLPKAKHFPVYRSLAPPTELSKVWTVLWFSR